MAEWYMNLTPEIFFMDDTQRNRRCHRTVLAKKTELIENGFVTCGSVMEGVGVTVDEGGNVTDQAVTHIAFSALPDGRTCLGLQYCVTSPDRSVFTRSVKTLHLCIPNDVYNGFKRKVELPRTAVDLISPAPADESIDTESEWMCIDGVLGIISVYGGSLKIDRQAAPRGGRYENLRVEEICLDIQYGAVRRGYSEIIADCGFAVLCNADSDAAASFSAEKLTFPEHVRGMKVIGLDGNEYVFAANFGEQDVHVSVLEQDVPILKGTAALVLQER
jgi:hypothetical protein